MDFSTLASAAHLSREDRRAYLKGAERDEREAKERQARRDREAAAKRWR